MILGEAVLIGFAAIFVGWGIAAGFVWLVGRTDIAQVIGEHVALAKSGAQLRGLCPFHAERTGSFYVYPHKQFFICYGCGKKGDVFRFLQLHEKLDFPDAVRFLATRLGMKLPETTDGEAGLYSGTATAQDHG